MGVPYTNFRAADGFAWRADLLFSLTTSAADLVTEAVVDLREPVDVDDHDRDRAGKETAASVPP
jgi:hypothetical protein